MLCALNSVAALVEHLDPLQTVGYQSAAMLGRIPLFMSAAIGLAASVHVVNAGTDGEVREQMGHAVRLYSLVAVPDSLVHLLDPSRYTDALALLRFTAIFGGAVGWIDVVSTAHQARARFRPAIHILGVAAVAQPILLICAGRVGGVWCFAAALVSVSVVAAVIITVNARGWLAPRLSLRKAAVVAATLAGAILLHGSTVAWIGPISILGPLALRALGSPVRPVSRIAQPSPKLDLAPLALVDVGPDGSGGHPS